MKPNPNCPRCHGIGSIRCRCTIDIFDTGDIDPRFISASERNQLIMEKLTEVFYGNHPLQALADLKEIFDLLDKNKHKREAERCVDDVDNALHGGYWPPKHTK